MTIAHVGMLREELRVLKNRVMRLDVNEVRQARDVYRQHPLYREGDGKRVLDLLLSLLGPGSQVVAFFQRRSKNKGADQFLNRRETLLWISELEGTLNRAGNKLTAGQIDAMKLAISMVRLQVEALERGTAW